MTKLRKALEEYLAIRRALGFKLRLTGRLLHRFVEFAAKKKASFVTTKLALEWAIQPKHAQPAQWANRLRQDVLRACDGKWYRRFSGSGWAR